MVTLEPIEYNILNDGERLALTDEINNTLSKVAPEQCKELPEMHTVLNEKREDLSAAMERILKSNLTTEIKQDDTIRGDALDFIEDTAVLYTRHRNERFRTAAMLISKNLTDSFESINRNNNSEESVGIKKFEEKMTTTEASEAATLLRITDDLNELFTTNNNYMENVRKRSTLKENESIPLSKTARRELRREIRALESFLEYKARRDSEIHVAVIEALNGPIQSIMSVAKARQTRNDNSAE